MSFQNKKFTLTRAEKKDTADIEKIMKSGSFSGGIEIQYLRGDDPLASFEKEGTESYIYILREKEHGEAVGMGGCIVRPALVNGKIKRAGYLTGLKVIPEYQRRVMCIPEIYRFLYEETKNYIDFYYSSILEENTAALLLLEKRHKNMPEYRFLDSYIVYFCKTGNFKKTNFQIARCDFSQAEEFYIKEAEKYNLTYPSLNSNDLKNGEFYGIYENSQLLGIGYFLNQQDYKNYVIKSYSGIYKYISKLPTRLLKYPSFPKENHSTDYISMGIMVKDNNVELGYELITQLLKISPKRDFVMLGLLEKDPLNKAFSRIKNIKYRSRIYHVTWDKEDKTTDELKEALLKLEVAFL